MSWLWLFATAAIGLSGTWLAWRFLKEQPPSAVTAPAGAVRPARRLTPRCDAYMIESPSQMWRGLSVAAASMSDDEADEYDPLQQSKMITGVDGSIVECRAAVKRNPGRAVNRFNLGVVLHESGDFDGADREYCEALRINPDFGGAQINRGHLLGEARRDEVGAERCYQAAIAIDASLADAHWNMSILYERCGDWDRASRALHDYIRSGDPDGDGDGRLAHLQSAKYKARAVENHTAATAAAKKPARMSKSTMAMNRMFSAATSTSGSTKKTQQ